MKSGEMRLEEAKKLQNVFKSNLNKILRGRYKSGEEKSVLKNIKLLYESWETVIELFSNYSSIVSEAKYKSIDEEGLKILAPKQMLQRLPIAIAKVKAGNTSENILNKIREIIYSLHQAKEITEKVHNNIMNSIKIWNKMDTIFMNSENSKTSDPHRILLNLLDKINLKSI